MMWTTRARLIFGIAVLAVMCGLFVMTAYSARSDPSGVDVGLGTAQVMRVDGGGVS